MSDHGVSDGTAKMINDLSNELIIMASVLEAKQNPESKTDGDETDVGMVFALLCVAAAKTGLMTEEPRKKLTDLFNSSLDHFRISYERRKNKLQEQTDPGVQKMKEQLVDYLKTLD